nr:retrovirus-related Pol polyprotein from transposon TNT 1-94 [Tanacetum cinerariifolium]
MDRENPWGKDGTGKDVELYLYRSMIGSLMYLTTSRSDIMVAVCACARHQVTPKECHLLVVKRIFRGGSSFLEPLSLGNAMSFENRLEDFFRDASNVVSLNGVEIDLSNMETAIQFKIQNVWVLVDCPDEVRLIGMKWVLKNKKDKRCIVIKNKARLVAQGHTQEEEIVYEEVFTPVARTEAIRLFLAYASYMGFTLYQMDVNSAFLYVTIDEEPLGFQDTEFLHRVYKIEKAMYGLNQAPRAWYGTLSKYLLDNVFYRGTIDQTLFAKKSMIGSLVYLTTSRPDIMFAVCACARHQVTPKECHLYVVKRIFRYLKGNPKLGLWYLIESPFDLVAYSDSDSGYANQDRKSTTGGYDNVADFLTKAFDVGRFQYLV